MQLIRTHKIALDPTRQQQRLLWQHVGYARFAYNWGLRRFINRDKDAGEWPDGYTLRPEFNTVKAEIAAWSAGLSQMAAKNALLDLHKAISRWGGYRKALKAGCRPRFVGHPKWRRKRGRCQSYQADNGPGTVKIHGRRVRLPKVGEVRMREELRFAGSVRKVVVKHDGRRWYVCERAPGASGADGSAGGGLRYRYGSEHPRYGGLLRRRHREYLQPAGVDRVAG